MTNRHTTFATILLALALAWVATAARATCQEGCLSNFNTALGEDALLNGGPVANTVVGFNAGKSLVTGGDDNTAIGQYALTKDQTGGFNTAVGVDALYYNQSDGNTAVGFVALENNDSGLENTAVGEAALASNIDGWFNIAVGAYALYSNAGEGNTAVGVDALYSNTDGFGNAAMGSGALYSNTTGFNNTAEGSDALLANSSGGSNTAIGFEALFYNTTASSDTAVGNNALVNNTTGGSNIAMGDSAGSLLTTGKNNIDIGNKNVAGEGNTIRVGKSGTHTATFIAGITGTTVAGGVGVLIGSNGRLGTINSSARYKENIRPMDKESEAILSLQPVTFRYKKELDPKVIPQFALVAEQVEKVNPDLVARDEDNKPYSVRYEAVNAMLLNEFLKEHRTVQEQKATISRLQSAIAQQRKEFEATAAQQEKEIKALAAGLQRVSNQLGADKPASWLVSNNQ